MSSHSKHRKWLIGHYDTDLILPLISLFHCLLFSSFCGLWSLFPKIVFFTLCCSQWEGLRGIGSSLTKCIQQFFLLLLPLLLPLPLSSFPSSPFLYSSIFVYLLCACHFAHVFPTNSYGQDDFSVTNILHWLCSILFLHTKILMPNT